MKSRIIIILLVLVVIVAGLEAYQIKKLKDSQSQYLSQIQQLKKQAEPVAKKNYPAEIDGKVVGLTPSSLIIDQAAGALEVPINVNTPVFDNEHKKISIVDVKAGSVVKTKLNEVTGAVLEATIVK